MKVEKKLKIGNKLGLHARPAALFVKTAGQFKCQVLVSKGTIEVNGKSMMGLMMLAAEHGAELRIVADGEDAAAAVRSLEELFHKNFHE